MRTVLVVLIGLGVTSMPTPVSYAKDPADQHAGAQDLLEDATGVIMQALSLINGSIPQYQLPEVLDNGDIIIRKVRPKAPPKSAPSPADGEIDETST